MAASLPQSLLAEFADLPDHVEAVFHRTVPIGPQFNVKVTRNSRGTNFEATVTGCAEPQDALALLAGLTAALVSRYGKDSDQHASVLSTPPVVVPYTPGVHDLLDGLPESAHVILHRTIPSGPQVNSKIETTTLGVNFEVTVTNARSTAEALALLDETVAGIEKQAAAIEPISPASAKASADGSLRAGTSSISNGNGRPKKAAR